MTNQRFLARAKNYFYKIIMGDRYIPIRYCLIILTLNGCAGSNTFRVLDAATREPIEGAVALAFWNQTSGLPGLATTHTVKALEAITNAEGFFRIPGFIGTSALQAPHIKVYKPGYVGWDSRLVYIGCSKKNKTVPIVKKRDNFSMNDQDIYLEPWKEEYTFVSHGYFLNYYHANLYEADITDSKYREAVHYEFPFRIKEKERIRRTK